MPTTLTYGRKKPTNGDDSAVWFDALEDNIVLDDAHTHNGTDSALISGSAVGKESVLVKATGDWSLVGDTYELDIVTGEIPSGFKSAGTSSSALCHVKIMDSDSGDEQVFLEYDWSGAGATASLTLYSPEVLNIKILFI